VEFRESLVADVAEEVTAPALGVEELLVVWTENGSVANVKWAQKELCGRSITQRPRLQTVLQRTLPARQCRP
jgi:hypothetical protein